MRFQIALLALASAAFAQNTTYLAELAAALQAQGLTTLASAASATVNTTEGKTFLSVLDQGNKTVFAPSDAAFEKVPQSAANDPDTLANILSYHILQGSLALTQIAVTPNHTIARTFLNSTSASFLEGNASQPLVFTNSTSSNTSAVEILNQATNVTISKTFEFQNLVIHVVNAVLTIPVFFSDALTSAHLTAFQGALQQTGQFDTIAQQHGVTIFAPTDDAFSTAMNSLTNGVNSSVLATILGNHIINGTTVYSTLFGNSYTSASGESFSLVNNGSGTFVTSGNSTAKVTQSDILINNGVIHIIDAVLFNNQSDAGAASSAFSSATANAAGAGTATGTAPVGTAPSSASSTLQLGQFAAALGVGAVGAALGAALVF